MPGEQFRPQPLARPVMARPSIGVYFRCANAYVRVFRSADASHYLARCPNCGRTIRFRVGPNGTNQRLFEVTC